LSRQASPGFGFQGRWNLRGSAQLSFDRIRTGSVVLPRTQLLYDVLISPSQRVPTLQVTGTVGQAIDFVNHRGGSGSDIAASATLRPSIHLDLELSMKRRTLDAPAPASGARVLTAQVERVRASYHFSRRSFLRLVGEYSGTRRDPALYAAVIDARTANFNGSVLFAYKLNWQTVFFVGYGDERELVGGADLAPLRRELFVKLSYGLQR